MSAALKYIIDGKGKTTSVLVPLKTWEKLNSDFSKLHKKLEVIDSIRQGLIEIKNAKKTGRKLQTLNDFLRESNN
jgi:hypothetical protein